MKVLIACEFSGIVRDAFAARGHDAWSCDLLPTERPGQHIQGDVREYLTERWDLVIAHPPCTFLTYAGTAHWNKPGREQSRRSAMEFFVACYNANAPKCCVENPFGLPCQEFRQPSQIINPFDFGEPVRKRTCLWLRRLPILWRGDDLFGGETQPVPPPEPIYVGTRLKSGKTKARYSVDCMRPRRIHFTESLSHDARRAHERSRTFQSIANAMAEQWGTP